MACPSSSNMTKQAPDITFPGSPAALFTAFSLIALQGFGGIIGIIQRELVDRRRWLTNEGFLEDWAVAQVMPGPNVVNLGIILGSRYFGLRGAVAAVAGLLLFPLVLALLFAWLYGLHAERPEVANALRAMGAVATGLISAAGLRLALALRKHPLGPAWCIAIGGLSFAGIAFLRWPLSYVLLGLGTLSCVLTYRRLRP